MVWDDALEMPPKSRVVVEQTKGKGKESKTMPPPGPKQKKPAKASPPSVPVVLTAGAGASSVPDSEIDEASSLVGEEGQAAALLGREDDVYYTQLMTLGNEMSIAEVARCVPHIPISWHMAWLEDS